MLATDMTSGGSPEEKLRWAFKMYDKDASGEVVEAAQDYIYNEAFAGEIELKEMIEIVGTLLDMEGVDGVSERISSNY